MKCFRCLSLLFTFAFFCAVISSAAQQTTYRVALTDKGPEAFTPDSPLYKQTLALLSERALERRRKVRTEATLITREDAPLYAPYLTEIESYGRVLLQLRWANYLVVECSPADSAMIAHLPFVRKVEPTSSRSSILSAPTTTTPATPSSVFAIGHTGDNCGGFRYGFSHTQVSSINVQPLHSMGITGQNVLMGFLDSGFRWRTHNSMAHADVRAEYDFIFRDSITANQEPDIASQDDHGTLVLSTVAGFVQDTLIGTAPNASFLLGKTEDIRSEKHIEEDNYAAGVEWMESQGADIITSSLGYYDFNEGEEDYTYDQLDGNTTIVAQVVNRAVARGVVCVTAAGNEGYNASTGTIISPGDADSVITVGATAVGKDEIASFSSRGPRGDGKRKPDIAAQGAMVFCAEADGPYIIKTSDGTSLATPLLAGGAALLLSVYPELTPWEVRNILYSTASRAHNPDNNMGNGRADIFKAAASYGIAIAPDVSVYSSYYRKPNVCRVVAKMVSPAPALSATLSVRFHNAVSFRTFPMQAASMPYTYYADVPLDDFGDHIAQAFILADNGTQHRRMPYHPDSLLAINPAVTHIPCGIATADLPLQFGGSFIEGIHPSVVNGNNTGVATLVLNTPVQSDIQATIYNVLGREMASLSLRASQSELTNITIPVTSYAPGTYFVQVLYNGSVQSHPFTVVR